MGRKGVKGTHSAKPGAVKRTSQKGESSVEDKYEDASPVALPTSGGEQLEGASSALASNAGTSSSSPIASSAEASVVFGDTMNHDMAVDDSQVKEIATTTLSAAPASPPLVALSTSGGGQSMEVDAGLAAEEPTPSAASSPSPLVVSSTSGGGQPMEVDAALSAKEPDSMHESEHALAPVGGCYGQQMA